jgi:hypothetical protein
MKKILVALAVLALTVPTYRAEAQSVSVSVNLNSGPPAGPRFGPGGAGAAAFSRAPGPAAGPGFGPGAGRPGRPGGRPGGPSQDADLGPTINRPNNFMERLRNHQPYIPRDLPVVYPADTTRDRYFPNPNIGDRGAQRYGFMGTGSGNNFYGGVSFGYGNRLPIGSNNWRYINVNQIFDHSYGTDYRQKLVYSRLDTRTFPAVLDELAEGIFGALLVWPEQPGLAAHSAALEKFFTYLDRRITARLVYAEDVSPERRQAIAREIVRETLAPLVDSVTVIDGEYQVSFRLPGGRKSPWVEVPMIFFNGDFRQVAAEETVGSDGFKGVGPFVRQGGGG